MAPPLPWRGTIEGFYGRPWSHDDRLAHLQFAAQHRLNTYVYAPKDDPFHRARWREPYPPDALARLGELATAARRRDLRFVLAIAPGLSMQYSDPAEHAALAAKTEQLWRVGIRDFALLFDDIPAAPQHAADIARFGPDEAGGASAHAETCARLGEVLRRWGGTSPLIMVPTEYAGIESSPYRDRLARDLPDEMLVGWTGRDVVVGEVTRADLDAAAAGFAHRLLLWDNFPVNDFDPARVFLGPLTGRAPDLGGPNLAGILANPMPLAAASRLALATVAEFAWNPGAYEPIPAASRALAEVAGADAAALAPLVASCSGWPPSGSPWPELSGLLEDAPDRARGLLTELATAPDQLAGPPSRLVVELRPWLGASVAMARAGLAALELLAAVAAGSVDLGRLRAATRGALADAMRHDAHVLRSVVPPFVEAALTSSDRR